MWKNVSQGESYQRSLSSWTKKCISLIDGIHNMSCTLGRCNWGKAVLQITWPQDMQGFKDDKQQLELHPEAKWQSVQFLQEATHVQIWALAKLYEPLHFKPTFEPSGYSSKAASCKWGHNGHSVGDCEKECAHYTQLCKSPLGHDCHLLLEQELESRTPRLCTTSVWAVQPHP